MLAPKYDLNGLFDPAQAHPDDAHTILMRHIPPGSRVLELGCSSGYLSGYMENALDCKVVGLEYDTNAVEIAKERCSHAYQADLDNPAALAPAREHGPYDVLFAAAVLEHLKYAPTLLENVKPLLKPGACVIVSLPNVAHWSVRWQLLRGRFDYDDYGIMDRTHLYFYTLKTGRALLEDAGYPVDEIAIAGSLLQNLINGVLRRLGQGPAVSLLPNLLAYELIYIAHLSE